MSQQQTPFVAKVGGENPDVKDPGVAGYGGTAASKGDWALFIAGTTSLDTAATKATYLEIQGLTKDGLTTTGTLTSGSAVVTTITATAMVCGVGSTVSGTGIPAGATVVSIDSATQITLSLAATASGAQTLTFGPGVATFRVPAFRV